MTSWFADPKNQTRDHDGFGIRVDSPEQLGVRSRLVRLAPRRGDNFPTAIRKCEVEERT
jgi:hypothetical protein